MHEKIQKVAIFGLDCAEPSLMFERWLDRLPVIRSLMQRGTYGKLTSCLPPITVPAWSCMASSKDPGTLGIYGFRNRADHSYDKMTIATSLAVREPRLWDLMTQHKRKSIVVGVPGTYPIAKPPDGSMVSCFLTPDTNAEYTYPRKLKEEIAAWVGDYQVDVKGFRTDDKDWLLRQIYDMTNKRFKVVNQLLESRPWDLFWMVEMGTDRIHHGFWQFLDPTHHRYQPGNKHENAIRDYYVHTDGLIGDALKRIDLETTAVWVVSDHGAKVMHGGFCFNDWLIREGLLTLKQKPDKPTKFDVGNIDWTKTKVWGDGGYYGRCFINLQGREPNGTVSQAEYEPLRNELIRKLEAVPDHHGRPMGTRAYKPEAIYKSVRNVAPDLVVIFGDLHWRSVGTVGNPSVYTFENDTGPDDANHAQQGLYIYCHPSLPARGRLDGPTLYDVAPTTLDMMGLPAPQDMQGRSLL